MKIKPYYIMIIGIITFVLSALLNNIIISIIGFLIMIISAIWEIKNQTKKGEI